MAKPKHTPVQRKQQKKFRKNFQKVRSLKEGRIIVRNLPFKATEEAIKKFFDTCGPIREVNLLRRPDGNPVGCAFIQFNDVRVAKQAIQSCSKKQFLGRNITADLALEQGRYITSRPDLALNATADENDKYENDDYVEEGYDEGTEEMIADVEDNDDVKEEKPDVEDDDIGKTKPDFEIDKDMPLGSEEVPKISKSKLNKQKRAAERRATAKSRRGRVVVRNVSFKATEEDLKKHFSNYGELMEVNLLRKPDGRMVGCAFLEYRYLKHAALTIKHASGVHFLGRPVVIDWAVPKTEYNKNDPSQDIKIKEEPLDDDEVKIEIDEDDIELIKSEPDSDSASEGDMDEEEDDDDDDDYGEAEDMDLEEDTKKAVTKPQEKYCSNDVYEGRTVFVKNVPFSVDNKEFRVCMEQFGEVEYAVICYDPLTEHSKGTGFAKFKDTASTQRCLEAGTELTLYGQILDCHKALDRSTIQAKGKTSTDKKASKDNRHLYLVKEGVVLAGSKAAENVSITDMAKRLKLEQVKTQMLRKLNMFVSNTRLIVHNVPPLYDDKRLRELFLAYSGPSAVITEARVMRNMMNVDENGVGQSKEMGFVRFTTQEDAITALREINNNPHIFTVSKRPIVTFAIENRMIHKIKQQREQKSRDKNPLYNTQNRQQTVDEKKASRRARRAAKRLEAKNAARATAASKKGVISDEHSPKKSSESTVKEEGKSKDQTQSNNGGYVGKKGKTTTGRPPKKSSASTGKEEGKSKDQTQSANGIHVDTKGKKTARHPPKKSPRNAVEEEGKSNDWTQSDSGNYVGVAAEPGVIKMRSRYNLKTQAALHTQVVRKDMQKKKSKKRLKQQQKIHEEPIRQPKQKQGSQKSLELSGEGDSFSNLVNKYKSQLTPAMMKTKWYDSQT